jgi:NitT/TauT family transport system substrate-binding protein
MTIRLIATLAGLSLLAGAARAETQEIRVAAQYGLGYLPMQVAADRGLVEKRLKEAGLPDTKLSLRQLGGGPVVNDALLSGSIDVGMGGGTVMMTLWDKTMGRQNVRGIVAFCDSPIYLVTTDPRIKSIRDYGPDDRIAVTGLKVTVQALFLEMAAAKEWGWDERFRLDPNAVAMPHPESMAAILSGRHEVKSHAATIPFVFEEVRDPRARVILTTNDVLGGRHNLITAWTTETWKRENPKSYAALAAGLEDAIELINRDPRAAAESHTRMEKTKLSIEQVAEILGRTNDVAYTATPHRTAEFADFMSRLGLLKNKPASWKDLFFENVHDKAGS